MIGGERERRSRAPVTIFVPHVYSRVNHEDGECDEENADEEATEDTDEEIVASGEDGGSGDAPTTPAGSQFPLLLGGVALLSVGGYAGLRFARSVTD